MSKEITATATKLLQLLEPAQDFAQEEGSSGHVNFIAAIRKMLRDGLECDASLKAYILCEISFEYNDEIYNSGENEGSHPSRLFLSKKAANAECRKMNLENFMETTPSQYCYDMEEICHSYEEANELFKAAKKRADPEFEGELEDYYGYRETPWTGMTHEEIEAIFKLFTLEFYKVVAIPLTE